MQKKTPYLDFFPLEICLGWEMNLGSILSPSLEINFSSADFSFLQEEKWHLLQLIHNRAW